MTFLEFADFSLELPAGAARPVLAEVNLRVAKGEVVGLVGESGSGKSTTAKAALGLVPVGATVTGEVTVGGEDVFDLDDTGSRRLRTQTASMIFQDARTAVNPVRRIGDFLTEQLTYLGWSNSAARERMVGLLDAVRVPEPERRFRQFPHELSGGMLQRVAIAAALATEPTLVLADEPTSALDASTQAETMAMLHRLQQERQFAMLFITHDLHLAAAVSDRVYVMYAGRVVEEQPGPSLFTGPKHPYTQGLLESAPDLNSERPPVPIPGLPLSLDEAVPGCPFAPRCGYADAVCSERMPEPTWLAADTSASCHRLGKTQPENPPMTLSPDGGGR